MHQAQSKYGGLRNKGEEAIAEILREEGLIDEISDFSLNELLRIAMSNSVKEASSPKFIESVEELQII